MLNLENRSHRDIVCVDNKRKKLKNASKLDYSDLLKVGKTYRIWALIGDRVYIKGFKPHVWFAASSFVEADRVVR